LNKTSDQTWGKKSNDLQFEMESPEELANVELASVMQNTTTFSDRWLEF